jgi:flagellar biosynthetic protein FliP
MTLALLFGSAGLALGQSHPTVVPPTARSTTTILAASADQRALSTPTAGATQTGASPAKTPIRRPTDSRVPSARPGPSSSGMPDVWGTVLVLAGIVLVLWLGASGLKRFAPQRARELPPEVIDLLGVQPLSPQQAIHLVRVGERLLVVGAGPDGLRTLTEIIDPAEVQHLTLLCRSSAANTGPASLFNSLPRLPASLAGRASRADAGSVGDASGLETTSGHTHFADAGTSPRLRKLGPLVGCLIAALLIPASLSAQEFATGRVPAAQFTDVASHSDTASPGVWRDDASTSMVTATPVAQADADQTESDFALQALSMAPSGIGSSLKLAIVIGVLSLAPAILLMTTCYIRIVVVLGILRQALGVPQFPPTQVLTSLSLFLTAMVMWPVWESAYRQGIEPYSQATYNSPGEQQAALATACTNTAEPVRRFMSRQIEATENTAAVDLFLEYQAGDEATTVQPEYYEDVPLRALLPAYVLSELKTAFLIGFQLYLPFVVIDLVVTSLLTSLGLTMLSPGLVSLPFKLLLFVLIDGWYLTVELLLNSIAPLT